METTDKTPFGLKRHANWHNHLHKYLEPHVRAAKPFAYGDLDCALFACGGIEAITGVDLAADFRGKYSNRRTALEAIRAYCGSASIAELAAKVTAEHGIAEILPNFAQRGDVVVCGSGVGASLMLVGLQSGPELMGVGANGLLMVERRHAVRAWAIGRTPGEHELVLKAK